MRPKILSAFCCLLASLAANQSFGRWPTQDPKAESYYSQSPYSYCGSNPVNNIDPDGRDWYQNEAGDMIWRRIQDATFTDDNGVAWNNVGTTYVHNRNDGSAIYFYQNTDDEGNISLASRDFSRNEMAAFNTFHSEKAKQAAMAYQVNPNMSNFFKVAGRELAAQWTDPYLLTSGASIGVMGLQTLGAIQGARSAPSSVGPIQGHTNHGLMQSIMRDGGRGVHPSAIADAVNNPVRVVNQSAGRTMYIGRNATVVLNQEGKIITTYGKPRNP